MERIQPILAQAPPEQAAALDPEPTPAEETTARCDHCDEAAPDEDDLHEVITTYRPRQTARYCLSCADEKSWACDRCDRLWLEGPALSRRTANELEICPICYHEDYFTCDSCDRVLHNDDYGEDDRCERCRANDRDASAEIDDHARGYTGVHAGAERGPFPTLRLCGVELECEEGDASQLADALPAEVGIHHDGSLDDRTGAEMVTPPASGTELERLIRECCRAARESGYETSSACGLHVHVEYPEDEAAVRRLFTTVYALEDLLFGLLGPSRLDNDYCVPLRVSYAFDGPRVGFWRKWYVQKPKEKHKQNETRYHGLNLHSVYYRGTVEFRYHEGTLQATEAINWVRVCQSLVQYALKRYKRSDLVEELRLPAHRDWDGKLERVAALLAWPRDLAAWARERVNAFGRRRSPYPTRTAKREMLVRLRLDREERNWARAHVGIGLLEAVA